MNKNATPIVYKVTPRHWRRFVLSRYHPSRKGRSGHQRGPKYTPPKHKQQRQQADKFAFLKSIMHRMWKSPK